MSAADAAEFIIAGASLIAVGTASFVHPGAVMEILSGLEQYCREQNINVLRKLQGTLKYGKQPFFAGCYNAPRDLTERPEL